MTVEERAQRVIDELFWGIGINPSKEAMKTYFVQALRDQIEDCAKVADAHSECGEGRWMPIDDWARNPRPGRSERRREGEWKMNARERAQVITPYYTRSKFYPSDIEHMIEQAIIAAVEAEREACAMIADEVAAFLKDNKLSDTGDVEYVAHRIRAQSEGEKKGE